MSWIFGLFVIEVFSVFLVDFSGFISEMEKYLTSWFKSPVPLKIPKPAGCSLCLSWWIGLIYLLVTGEFCFLSLLVLVLLCANTGNVLHGLYTIQDLIETVLGFIDRLVGWWKS